MESIPEKEKSTNQKKLFDINNEEIIIENDYCPHIFDHYLNTYLNSKFHKINLSHIDLNNQSNTNNKKDKYLYFTNLSLLQNSYKTFNYYGYNQSKNMLNSFLVKNISLDWTIFNNTQNVSLNSINKEGCVFAMSFNDTGNLMGASNHHNRIEIWDIKSKKLKKMITSHTEIVSGIDFFHKKEDNEYFITCSLDKTIKLWKNYENIHTFLEHSDWVRCISVREDNTRFLSGCVSSIVKLWDIPTQRVIGTIINENSDSNCLTTVNSLNFMNNDPNVFLIGLRSGEVKICDSRIQNKNDNLNTNIRIIHCFKAHKNKLNTIKLNQNNTYILTSGRDSSVCLWDLRKLPKENEDYINKYNKHKCSGYNIECNYHLNENYIITGSEDGNIYIYDINDNKKYCKLKTKLKCINLIKEIPNTYNISFTGLEEISIFIWNANKNISKFYEKYCCLDNNKNDDNNFFDSDNEKDLNDEDTYRYSNLGNKLIEEVMTECGDVIMKLFHSNNLTYSNGINYQRLSEILQNNNDPKTKDILKKITDKFMKKMLENLMENLDKKDVGKTEKKKEKKKILQKNDIKCLECKENTNKKNDNIFNSVDKELLTQLLVLPNNYGFYVENENKIKNI